MLHNHLWSESCMVYHFSGIVGIYNCYGGSILKTHWHNISR